MSNKFCFVHRSVNLLRDMIGTIIVIGEGGLELKVHAPRYVLSRVPLKNTGPGRKGPKCPLKIFPSVM